MKMYQVDAFTKELFRGNPAAVIVGKEWPDADLMQKIALENNLSETAFVKIIDSENYEYAGLLQRLRWIFAGMRLLRVLSYYLKILLRKRLLIFMYET